MGGVPAQAKIEPVGEFYMFPGAVGLEIRRAYIKGGGIVRGAFRVDGAVYAERQRGVVEGVVLGVAAYSDVGFVSLEVSNVGEEGV